jgi:uncharacterized membrane protein YeaQ/YmgE (transglycosylase-associated protein family)
MNNVIWLFVGGLMGWLASIIMQPDVVGIVGAFLGGWFLSPLFGVSTINQSSFTIGNLVVSLVGAVALLSIVNLVRRGTVR